MWRGVIKGMPGIVKQVSGPVERLQQGGVVFVVRLRIEISAKHSTGWTRCSRIRIITRRLGLVSLVGKRFVEKGP